jgi:hypothetical protein
MSEPEKAINLLWAVDEIIIASPIRPIVTS